MHPKKRQEMPLLFVPHQFSVIIGKGRDARDAPGTRFLRAEIQSKLHLYKTCTGRLERAQIVSDLLTEQQRRCPLGGVFVKFDGERWWELSEHDARENITAAFRNRLHEKYTSSSKFKSAKRRMQLKRTLAVQSSSKDIDQEQQGALHASCDVLLRQAHKEGEEPLGRGEQQEPRCTVTRTYAEPPTIVSDNNEDENSGWKQRLQSLGARRSTSPSWSWYPNKILDHEVVPPAPPCDGTRTEPFSGEDTQAVSEEGDDLIINCMISAAKSARMAGTSRFLVGYHPPLHPYSRCDNVHSREDDKGDHPQEDGWTTIASSSSSSSSGHDHDGDHDSLEGSAGQSTTTSTTSRTSSNHNFTPVLPAASYSSGITTPIGWKKQPIGASTSQQYKPPAMAAGASAALSGQAELKLWAACYLPLPPIILWNGMIKSGTSPGGAGADRRTGDMTMAYMIDDDVSRRGWNHQVQVDALLEPVNPNIFEE